MKKIVTIGGGTGQYVLLRGLRSYDVDLTALVSMVDNGGSTGKLRDEFGYLPAGDLRRCLVALSEDPGVLRDLFEHRIGVDCIGNQMIAGLQDIVGKERYVQEAGKLIRLRGNSKVIPITINDVHLYARTNNDKRLDKQTEVSYSLDKNEQIEDIWLEPPAFIFRDAAQSIRNSDLIVISPGDLYGSIIPNFLVGGFNEALQDSNAQVAYVCNLVTKQGTYNFNTGEFVKEIEKYAEKKVDYVIANKKEPTKKVVDKYKGERSLFVEPSLNGLERELVTADLLIEYEVSEEGKTLARHNPEETARIIMNLV